MIRVSTRRRRPTQPFQSTTLTFEEALVSEFVQVSDILIALRTIENLCTTVHWTSKRRWDIEQVARELRKKLEKQHGFIPT